ncbi:DUF202 domain-containing protein [Streptomyces sp. SBT349]|uniref:DUF202 domain-containing protein n=1 Tax=Streptomyces sp. SBT349 TaxID=1580539 RepID=UPI00066DBC7A|nr:DUF202 domain-containing protein [Streptomyces sp. SBT349]
MSPGGPPHARDPGAQPERTRLAWRRTTLSFALVVILAGRGLVTGNGAGGDAGGSGRALGTVAVAVAALLWVGFLGLAHRRLRVLAHRRPVPPDGVTVLGAAAAVAATALLAAGLVTAGGGEAG